MARTRPELRDALQALRDALDGLRDAVNERAPTA